MKSVAVVGAGLSGAVISRQLAEAGFAVSIFDVRSHVAGNCHTERDAESGIMVHKFGPHIFHTNSEEVWTYVGRFSEMVPFVNRVKAIAGGSVYSLPINLLTINQFFGGVRSPAEARAYIEAIADTTIQEPRNFEEQALRFVGRELYEAFFKGYTRKQWGLDPSRLPASVLKRLPLRFNYDDNYYVHRFQGMPQDGYTEMVRRILDAKGISVYVDTKFDSSFVGNFGHVFWSGPIDAFFGRCFGPLAYRTLDFEVFRDEGDYQGCAVVNYCDESVAHTRITEHKHFSPWETHKDTICFREYSRECQPDDIPYYPVRLADDESLLAKYVAGAKSTRDVSFVGRLGTYRYLDMDVAIMEALDVARNFIANDRAGLPQPAFFRDPLKK